jgi:hypothetical protein
MLDIMLILCTCCEFLDLSGISSFVTCHSGCIANFMRFTEHVRASAHVRTEEQEEVAISADILLDFGWNPKGDLSELAGIVMPALRRRTRCTIRASFRLKGLYSQRHRPAVLRQQMHAAAVAPGAEGVHARTLVARGGRGRVCPPHPPPRCYSRMHACCRSTGGVSPPPPAPGATAVYAYVAEGREKRVSYGSTCVPHWLL